jgi:predicted transcriptional regulator
MTRVSEVYKLLKELRCATALEIATRLGIPRKVAQAYLSLLVARGLAEKRALSIHVVIYCVREDGNNASHKPGDSPATTRRRRVKRGGLYAKTREKLTRTLEILQRDGCISVGALMRMMRISYIKAYHLLRVALLTGRGVKVVIGKTAVLCRDRATAEETVARLRDTVHRLVAKRRMNYVTPTKVMRLVENDRETYELLSRFVPLRRRRKSIPPAVLWFASHILRSLYGEPLRYGRKVVYVVSEPRNYPIDIVDSETHVVRVALSSDLAAALQGASVEKTVLQAIEQLLQRYKP